MNLLELMKTRCSVRRFTDQAVEKEKLLQVLEAGRIAPSAANKQSWHFIVLQEEASKMAVSEKWGAKAPVIIVACGDHDRSWHREDGKDHCDIDVAIAVDHMTLMAASLGLGTCWVCQFDARAAEKALHLPAHLEAVALLPIGYPAKLASPDRHERMRKPLEEMVEWKGEG